MLKLRKGKYAYLKRKKAVYSVYSLILFSGVAGLLLIGYLVTGRMANLFSLFGLLTAIPFALVFTNLLGILPYRGPSLREEEEIASIVGGGVYLTELVIANSKGRSYLLTFSVITEAGVLCYSADPKLSESDAEPYIRNYLRLNESDAPVSILKDYGAFLSALRQASLPLRDSCSEVYLKQEGVLIAISM